MAKKTKRTLVLEGTGLPTLDVTRVTEVDMPKRNLFIEEMPDGKFRVTYSKSLIPDINLLEAIRLVREEV
jgi:hypothetical protein